MALPVLDGNQSATTLSSVVTGGEHIVAHSVVSLGQNAISDITTAVSGSVVSVSNFPASQSTTFGAVTGSVSVLNFPATQTIAGTVTAALRNYTVVTSGSLAGGQNENVTFSLSSVEDGSLVALSGTFGGSAPVYSLTYGTLGQGDVTLSLVNLIDQQTITEFSGEVLVGFIKPRTSSNFNLKYISGVVASGSGNWEIRAYQNPAYRFPQPVSGSVTIGAMPAISGTVTAAIMGFDGSAQRQIAVGIDDEAFADGNGRVAVEIVNEEGQSCVGPSSGSFLSIGGFRGTLTTRFGTPTTASSVFATSAVTNASRKYLLIQNVTTQSNVITVGIGFTPTTTQGIQLTAGAGITFESSYIPTGQVFILSSVTASNFTILEA